MKKAGEKEKGGLAKNIKVSLNFHDNTITAEAQAENVFGGLMNGPVRLTVKPSVRRGQLALEVQKAEAKPRVPLLDVEQPFWVNIPTKAKTQLQELLNKTNSDLNSTLAKEGGSV